MKQNMYAYRLSQVCSLGLLAFGTLFVAGCGSAALQKGVSDPHDLEIPGMQGMVHGGQQPVIGSTINLYAVGLPTSGGGYGAGQSATLLTSGVTTTGPDGAFSITGKFGTCPSNSYVYITATGGDAGGGTNSALALMAALGPCSGLASIPFATINEVTTVAGVWALQQFASADFGTAYDFNIGAPSTNLTGLKNAFSAATAGHMVSMATGVAPLTTTATATINGTSVALVTQNEQTKINSLANILASCVNSADGAGGALSAPCTSLFNSVKPSGQTLAAADTMQAALDMALNPTIVGSTSTPPFNLTSTSAPFQPSLSVAPKDFTLGLAYGSTAVLGASGSQSYFLYQPLEIAIDSNGDVYSLNGPASATTSPFNSVGVIDPTGKPVASYYGGSSILQPRGFALDTSNNIWVANQGTAAPANALAEFTSGTYTVAHVFVYSGAGLYGIAIDGNNNVFVGSNQSSKVAELTGGTGTLTNLTGSTGVGPSTIALDSNSNLWVGNGSGTTVSKYTATCTTLPCTYATPSSYTGFLCPFGIAIDSSDIPWVSQQTVAVTGCTTGSNVVVKLDPATTANGGTATTAGFGGIASPLYVAMDGASNVWIADQSAASVTELKSGSTTATLSPAAGYAHTYNGPKGIAIDMSGNAWIGNAFATNAASSYTLTEIIGAAVPAVQPLSKAVALGKIGAKP